VPSIYQPRRPRASPLWQIIHHGWDDFLVRYEKHHRKSLGKLPPYSVTTVQSFLRCGDLASGFTRLFHTATATLQDAFRIRLGLPQGRIGAISAVHTFGDSLKIA
jgi:hypothetical protein